MGTGIRASFKQSLRDLGLDWSEEANVFDLYKEEEEGNEALKPYPVPPHSPIRGSVSGSAIDNDTSGNKAPRIAFQIPLARGRTLACQLRYRRSMREVEASSCLQSFSIERNECRVGST